jgi:hypothetical protein
VAFAIIFKVYFGLPGRVLGSPKYEKSPLVRLHEDGILSRPMHWNSIGHHMRDARMSEVLQYLIETSALPLMPVERGEYTHRLLKVTSPGGGDFSADATVIDGAARRKKGTRPYRSQREHDICKVHLMSGNLTNVVTACAIESRGAGESPLFPGLLYTTAKATRIANVFGDKAYTDTRTYALSEAVGAKGRMRGEGGTRVSGRVRGNLIGKCFSRGARRNRTVSPHRPAHPHSRIGALQNLGVEKV